jgi:hypothetical protein
MLYNGKEVFTQDATAAQWKAIGLQPARPDPPAERGGGDINLDDFF